MSTKLLSYQEMFDKRAKTYDREWLSIKRLIASQIDRVILNAVPSITNNPEYVLDVGCGTGRLLFLASEHFPAAKLVGIDISNGMISVARNKIQTDSQYHFGIASADDIPFPDKTFGIAFSTISFHYWDNPIISLREIQRVIKPGGFFLLADISVPKGFFGPVLRGYLSLYRRDQHFYTQEKLREMFIEAGLQVQKQIRLKLLAGSVLITVGERPLISSAFEETISRKLELDRVAGLPAEIAI